MNDVQGSAAHFDPKLPFIQALSCKLQGHNFFAPCALFDRLIGESKRPTGRSASRSRRSFLKSSIWLEHTAKSGRLLALQGSADVDACLHQKICFNFGDLAKVSGITTTGRSTSINSCNAISGIKCKSPELAVMLFGSDISKVCAEP